LDRNEFAGGFVLFLFGAATTLLSLRMPIGTFRMAGAGLFPLCLGILLMILSAAFVLKLFLQHKKIFTPKETIAKAPGMTKPIVLFVGTLGLATLFFNKLGYPLISFLLIVALLRILGMKRWTWNILLSLVTAITSYFLFVQWLKIPLPKGWIGL